MTYAYKEHTADIKFVATAGTFEEALAQSLLAVSNLLVETASVHPRKEMNISIPLTGKERLVIDTIEQFLFLFETEHIILAHVKDPRIHKDSFTATLVCDDAKGYEIETGIKAMTYHEMRITEDEKGCTIEGVVDI